MPLSHKASGSQASPRPGIMQSHRGRVVRNLLIAAGVVWLVYMMISSALAPEVVELTPEQLQQQRYEELNPVDRNPSIEVAPADPFNMQRVAALPGGFAGSTAHGELLATASLTAQEVATYSSRQTPEQYVESITALDDSARADLLSASQTNWPEIEAANISVKGSDAGVDPIIRAYTADAKLATLEVVVKQTVSHPDGTTTTQTIAYNVDLFGTEQDDRTVQWTVGSIRIQD